MMLISAPMSIRKWRPELLSVRNNRRLGEWPATHVAESDWPSHFSTAGMGLVSRVFLGLVSELSVVPAQEL